MCSSDLGVVSAIAGKVNTAVSQMDRVTQSTAANAEESAGAAQELNAQAAALQNAVRSLRTLVEGGRRAR